MQKANTYTSAKVLYAIVIYWQLIPANERTTQRNCSVWSICWHSAQRENKSVQVEAWHKLETGNKFAVSKSLKLG